LPTDAERWAAIADRGAMFARLPDGSTSIEPWLALVRALLCRHGVDRMRADAELAAKTIAPGSFWRATPILLLAMASLMAGEPDRADVLFEDAAAEGLAAGGMTDACVALAERSLLAIARAAWDRGERCLSEARSVAHDAHLEDYPPITILYAAAAQMALHEGDKQRAGGADQGAAGPAGPDLCSAAPRRSGEA
jgi:LuxR family maltose regulon positive regulatory protein